MGAGQFFKHLTVRQIRRQVLLLLIFLLILYFIVPQIKGLSLSFQTLQNANLLYIFVGVLLTALTYILAAGIYTALAFKELRLSRTLIVQISTGFTARLLPAGIGAMGWNLLYLKRSNHNYTEATMVVATNNLTGIIGHVLIGLITLTFGVAQISDLQIPKPPSVILIFIGISLTLFVFIIFKRFRSTTQQIKSSLKRSLYSYRKHPNKVVTGLVFNVFLTLVYVMILWTSAMAFGFELTFLQAFIALTFGIALGAATPTPGGLIGAEAGLVAGFVIYNIPADLALAATLLYRFLTYWSPLLPGFAAFVVVQRRLQLLR